MTHWQPALAAGLVCACVAALGGAADGDDPAATQTESARRAPGLPVQLGPRPYYLVDRMRHGPLRQALS